MGFLCHSFRGFVSTHPKIIEQTKPWCQPSHLPCCTASVPHPSASPISVQQGPARAPLMKIAGLEINRCQQYPTMISISEIQGVKFRYYEPIGCSMAISYHSFFYYRLLQYMVPHQVINQTLRKGYIACDTSARQTSVIICAPESKGCECTRP